MKPKRQKKVTITFDEGHLPVLIRALEGFMRFRSGQITTGLDEFYADKQSAQMKDKDYGHIDGNKSIEALVRKHYFKELKHPNEAWGVGQLGYGADDAYAISKTLRQYLAYQRNDGYRGFGVDFDGYIGGSASVPRPEIHGFSTRKFFKAPKVIQEKLDNLVGGDKKDYAAAYDLLHKKMPSLPKGDKLELALNKTSTAWGVWVTAPRRPQS